MVPCMRAMAWGWAIVAAASSMACGSTVVIEGSPGEGGASPDVPCVEPPTIAPAEVALRVDEAATLIDGRLHLTGSVDGDEGYFTPRLERGALWFDRAPLAIEGPAAWVRVNETWARVRGREQAGTLAGEWLDGDATTAVALEGVVPPAYRGTYSAFDGGLVFCHQVAAEAEMRLVAADASGALTTVAEAGCGTFFHASAAAGPLFVSWTLGTGPDSGFTQVTNLAAGGATVVSFGFAPNGVHQYGGINGAGTDGAVTVVSTDNDDHLLAFDAEGKTSNEGPYVFFSPAGPKRLLAVVDTWAYFATPDSAVAFDLGDIAAPVLVADRADADWDPASLTYLDATDDALLVRDADGRLWSVPRRLDGAVTAVSAYAGEPIETPAGCE